ncbi:fimbrin [Binucleata daphniae]
MQSRTGDIIDTSSIDNGLRKTITTDAHEEYAAHLSNEARAYSEHIAAKLPSNITFDQQNIFSELKNGIILAYFLYHVKQSCINIKKLVPSDKMKSKKDIYESTANLTLVLQAVKKLGIRIINIGPEDILYENKSLVLGLLWQLVRYSVSKNTTPIKKPELMNLLNENESIEDFCARTPEELCLRWINFHLANAIKENYAERFINCHYEANEDRLTNTDTKNSLETVFKKCFKASGKTSTINSYNYKDENISFPKVCKNFTRDIVDSRIYLVLMKQIAPEIIKFEDIMYGWIEFDLTKRAEIVLDLADKLDCKKFVTAQDIVTGDHRLNFLFCQTLMNKYPGMVNTTTNIEELKLKLKQYEEDIKNLNEKMKTLSDEIEQTRESEKQVLKLQDDLQKALETKSNDFESAISDMRASVDSFFYKIAQQVEDDVGISVSRERNDSKEKLKVAVEMLIEKVKELNKEKNDMIEKYKKQAEINKQIDMKILEYVEIQKNKKRQERKKDKCSIKDILGCNK